MEEGEKKKYKKGDMVIVNGHHQDLSAEVISFVLRPDGNYYLLRYIDRSPDGKEYDFVQEQLVRLNKGGSNG